MIIISDRHYKVTCVGDSNDGDYKTEINKLTGAELEKYVIPVAKALQKHKDSGIRGHNWNTFSYSKIPEDHPTKLYGWTYDEFCWFIEYFAMTDVHSIVEISIVEWVKEEYLFNGY